MDFGDQLRHEERLASNPNLMDVGIGPDLYERSEMDGETLASLLIHVFRELADGGSDIAIIYTNEGREITVYVRRHGRCIDIGTRRDFADLDLEDLCDKLDKKP